MANLTQLSKFIALVLRHKAQDYNLKIDGNGFVDLEQVWQLIEEKYGKRYTQADLETIVAGDKHGKKRYEIVDGKIRAMFGHSMGVNDINYPIAHPPQYLYHGTSQEAIESIKQTGLESRNRQYVHLTTNLDNAKRVADRHSKNIIILTIRALDAHTNGITFHQPESEHYLCKHIPPEYIDFD